MAEVTIPNTGHKRKWTRAPSDMPIADKLIAYSEDAPNGCRIWTRSRTWHHGVPSAGYGKVKHEGRKCYAHRLSYETFVGPIPEGMQIDHVKARGCTSRACINPAHLEPVTSRENTLRGVAAAIPNTHCAHGHALEGENVYVRTDGGRRCRVCYRAMDLKRRLRKRD